MVAPLSGILLLALGGSVTYELDAKASELLALTEPEGLKTAAHPHVIVAQQVKGTLVYDPEHPESASVRISFPTDWLVNDDPELRKREHFEPMSDSQRASVASNLRGSDQLDPKRFPTIEFESTAVRKLDDGKLEVKGLLGIRGVRKEITLPVTATLKDGVLRGEGSLVIKHSDFNFLPYSAALGLIRNADAITLRVRLVGKSAAPPALGSPARDGGAARGG